MKSILTIPSVARLVPFVQDDNLYCFPWLTGPDVERPHVPAGQANSWMISAADRKFCLVKDCEAAMLILEALAGINAAEMVFVPIPGHIASGPTREDLVENLHFLLSSDLSENNRRCLEGISSFLQASFSRHEALQWHGRIARLDREGGIILLPKWQLSQTKAAPT